MARMHVAAFLLIISLAQSLGWGMYDGFYGNNGYWSYDGNGGYGGNVMSYNPYPGFYGGSGNMEYENGGYRGYNNGVYCNGGSGCAYNGPQGPHHRRRYDGYRYGGGFGNLLGGLFGDYGRDYD